MRSFSPTSSGVAGASSLAGSASAAGVPSTGTSAVDASAAGAALRASTGGSSEGLPSLSSPMSGRLMLSSGPGAVSRLGAFTSSSALPKKRNAGISVVFSLPLSGSAAVSMRGVGWGVTGGFSGVFSGSAGVLGGSGAALSSANTKPVRGLAGNVSVCLGADFAGAFGLPKSMAFSSFISSSSRCSMALRDAAS